MKREARLLTFGIALAILAAAGFLFYGRQEMEFKPEPRPAIELPPADAQSNAGGGAVQLTPGEQQKIGLETEEVIQETVPRKAVLDTGGTKVVYIARGNGIFESRSIEVGEPLLDKYRVKSGLSNGERVVTSGAFMVYSHTKLTGGMTGLFGGSKSFAGTPSAANPPSHTIAFRMDPNPPVGGRDNSVHVTVSDSAGKTVSDAQVQMTLIMPAMPSMKMPEMRSGADLKWNGREYTGPISVSMAGPWNIIVEAKRGGMLLGTYRSHVEAR
jgi:Cu(I)/Ag(I) efflux system membrane fusion protein